MPHRKSFEQTSICLSPIKASFKGSCQIKNWFVATLSWVPMHLPLDPLFLSTLSACASWAPIGSSLDLLRLWISSSGPRCEPPSPGTHGFAVLASESPLLGTIVVHRRPSFVIGYRARCVFPMIFRRMLNDFWRSLVILRF